MLHCYKKIWIRKVVQIAQDISECKREKTDK